MEHCDNLITWCSGYKVIIFLRWCNPIFPPAIAFLTLLRGKTRKAIHSCSKDLENVQKRLSVCLCGKKYFHSRTMRTKKVI